jgi:hypothetical protein
VDNPVFNLSYSTLTHCQSWSLVKLTKNWPIFLLDNSRLPETVVKAVDRLMMVLDDEQKVAIATMWEEQNFP